MHTFLDYHDYMNSGLRDFFFCKQTVLTPIVIGKVLKKGIGLMGWCLEYELGMMFHVD